MMVPVSLREFAPNFSLRALLHRRVLVLGKSDPHGPLVEAIFARVDFAHVFVASLILQDLLREVLQFELFL